MPDSATGGFLAPTTSPTEDAALADLLQAWVVGMTGLPATMVRPRWQPIQPVQPEITENWCAIGVLSETPDAGLPYMRHDGAAASGTGESVMLRWWTIEVLASFYGPAAAANATRLSDGAYVGQNRQTLESAALVLIGAGGIVVAPELFQTQWVQRVDLPLTFARQVRRAYQIRNILSSAGQVATDRGAITSFDTENT